jgi:hypothetical protein
MEHELKKLNEKWWCRWFHQWSFEVFFTGSFLVDGKKNQSM